MKISLMRTNLFQASFEAEVEFTFRKLIDRGYDRNALRKVRNDIPWSQKAARTQTRVREKNAARVLPFEIRFSDAVHTPTRPTPTPTLDKPS